MSTALAEKTVTSMKAAIKETNQMRRRIAHADKMFDEGLSRLQSDYKERVRRAIMSDEIEQQEETPAAQATNAEETTTPKVN